MLICAVSAVARAAVFVDDVHSYSNPKEVAVTHLRLVWDVVFERKTLRGTVVLSLDRTDRSAPLRLDTRDLKIEKVEISNEAKVYRPTAFKLGAADKYLGSPLTVELGPATRFVRITYETSPAASGLQWLTPEQTAGKRTPFMFSQAQAIHARSFIPLQDSPQVRISYDAEVRTPKGLLAVMSAGGNSRTPARTGRYFFSMRRAIPPYLIAIAVGDLGFRSLGPRTGVYSEPSMLERSVFELADTEKMVTETEKIYGPYRWGRYDILVLPPSFPIGGMENPMLTFATPTIIAGDRSLVSLIAHELAHSWSGNLVTNSTWRDFWLNEGFTTYLERRIIEALYGVNRREMEAMLGKRSLIEELKEMPDADQILHVNLDGRDPDDGFTGVPYEKGALFLRYLEEKFGRARFDGFVKGYFNAFAFRTLTTDQFVAYLQTNLLDRFPGVVSRGEVEEWIKRPGLPATAPDPKSDNFSRAETLAKDYIAGRTPAARIPVKSWTTQEWLQFLKSMPAALGTEKMADLDRAFSLTKAGNSEIAFQWLIMSIRNDYRPAMPRLREFLTSIGRRKFVRPLFAELAKTPGGMKFACEIFSEARPRYHPITQAAVDSIVKCGT